ncbi:MAG TPA: hypothetical protein VFD01_16975 [Candidatus Dormibacteraeota bacterium]|nr:hypothetical protein [Candidatus Dormibacteraeota bacterium]
MKLRREPRRPVPQGYYRPLPAGEVMVRVCLACGALVVDLDRHDRWHFDQVTGRPK